MYQRRNTMFKIVMNCNETGETRTYENCRLLSENLPSIQLEATRLGGDWKNLTDAIHINLPSQEGFHELAYCIETLEPPAFIEKDWIRITIRTKTMYVFRKTKDLSEKWKDITMQVRLYGGEIRGNTFVFQKDSSASAFVNRFCSLFIH